MKQRYIKQVSKKLTVPAARKREIIRDLEEAFASALENNETEQQLIERLGPPEEFAASMGKQGLHSVKKANMVGVVISVVIAVFSFTIYAVTIAQQSPNSAIGQADAMTNIQVASDFAIDMPHIILLIGIIALVGATVNVASIIIKKRRGS